MGKPDLKVKLRLGFMVFGALTVLEIVEYLVGVNMRSGAWLFLAILAVPGAGLILYYFMHITQLRHPEE